MGVLWQDIRFALQAFRRTPVFPLAAILTLAIGIGATTAIFSTVNAALLKPLPYPGARDLYAIRTTLTDGRVTSGLLAPVEIARLNDPSLSIVHAAGAQFNDLTLVPSDGTPLKTSVYAVTEGFLDLFGLPMTLGEATPPKTQNEPPKVIISYRMWQDLYGGDRNVIGKPIRFAELATTVCGVASRDFNTPSGANFWLQLRLDPTGVAHNFEGYMRIKPGVRIERVKSEMDGVMAGIARDYPNSATARIYIVRTVIEQIVGDLGPILLVVLSATGLLLLLACVNVTNLLLARGAARSREIAVRVAIGAGRGRIVRQLLTESMVLATAGAAVGVFAAYVFVRLLLRMGAARLPRLDAVSFDSSVLLFALTVLFVSGLLVGFAPALRLAATNVNTLMNEGARASSAGRGTGRWLGVLTITEIALAVALVGGAGWLVRSFDNLSTTNPGFDPRGRLMFTVSLNGPAFRDNTMAFNTLNQLLERIRSLGGVISAGATLNFPLTPGDNSLLVHLPDEPMDLPHSLGSRQRIVSPGFFAAMGVKILKGRDFNLDDRPNMPQVIIVNKTFADRYLKGRDPLTTQIQAGYPVIDVKTLLTIIGVVDDIRQRSLAEPAEPSYYNTWTQLTARRQNYVVQTAAVDSPALRDALRNEVRKVDPQIPFDVQRVSDIVGATINREQLGMTLMLVFAGAAVVLAAVGIYGVIAYSTVQRKREVAIRLALGATQSNVFGLVLAQGARLAAIGAAIGLIVAYVAGRVVTNWLYQVRAADPFILGAATLVVVGITVLATLIPAVRAACLDPGHVLRPD
jgi:predicted permease